MYIMLKVLNFDFGSLNLSCMINDYLLAHNVYGFLFINECSCVESK